MIRLMMTFYASTYNASTMTSVDAVAIRIADNSDSGSASDEKDNSVEPGVTSRTRSV